MENQMIISLDTEKTFDKIWHPFKRKALRKVGIQDSFLNLIKSIYKKPAADIILNGEILTAFSLKLRGQDGLSPFLINVALELVASAIRGKKKTGGGG